MSRYSRQLLLPQIGIAGQSRLGNGRVLLVGCGALGTVIAEQLCRAGVGLIRIVDRDIVELSNLQRQTLFDERHAQLGTPKAVAAAERLRQINSDTTVDPHVLDLGSDNIERLAETADLIVDGTDNAATRYLVNDVSVKHGKPWIYGACVGVEGRVMPILPGGACLRCVFPEPPAAGELPTCDTVGVLASVASLVASWQAIAAIRVLINDPPPAALLTIDAWSQRQRVIDLAGTRRTDCPCCARNQFDFLSQAADRGASLCGRDAVQIRPPAGTAVDLERLAQRLGSVAEIERTQYLLRVVAHEFPFRLTVFPDGRAIIHGTSDPSRARSLYDKFVGG